MTILKHTHRNKGTCSRQVHVTLDADVVVSVEFDGGCSGNTQALAQLARGQRADELIEALEGIRCRNGTSCPDQLAKALREAREKQAKKKA